ncbi:MAG TPA: spermidine/putrescine ABC transporter substrate-binding protein, partial [Nordella sp.]|nr:spermidine/putrescine ABC transporter substrate-binding protein [Nordella sp.]
MKSILRTCTALTMVAAFGGQVMAQEMLQSLGAGEGEVSIVAWAGYLERGETDPAYDWVTKFEQDTGCKVTQKIAATSD